MLSFQVDIPECSALPSSVSSRGTTHVRQHVIYTSLDRSIQLHVVHPDVIDPLTSLGDPVVGPLTHVLLHYQSSLTYSFFSSIFLAILSLSAFSYAVSCTVLNVLYRSTALSEVI